MTIIVKIIIAILSLVILGFVIYYLNPPSSIGEASLGQLACLFSPFLIALVMIADLIYKFWIKSILVSAGITFLLILKIFDSLNFITGIITIFVVAIIIKALKKPTSSGQSKIPKLSKLKKQ
jgi:hypothetical protein